MGHPTGCSPKPVPSGLGYSFVLKMVPEFTLCSCMVYKAWTMYKNDSASPMLRILVDDRSASTRVCFSSCEILTVGQHALFF